MRKLCCLEGEKKLRENFAHKDFYIFFFKWNGKEWRRFKWNEEREREGKSARDTLAAREGRVRLMRVEEAAGREPHGFLTRPSIGQASFPRTSLAFFGHIRASELRFWIYLRIMNHDSLTHNDDYETLTKVENLSQKMMTKTTQRMRTQSSLAMSWGLET